MANQNLANDDIPVIQCNICPNSLRSRNGESSVQLLIRAVVVERWKISSDRKTVKCGDCVEKQVSKVSL